ncbi:hypothetical protein B0J11DRAFT_440047 [Dendryphion nanum]|uniref:Uncharacterized protein n=1 Tax=Dendryphion nanum TaxID=256645 RepID=A0A9P9DI56_9PLEO|nr:hypothetical protein B0J11DRAFT_440047 [Dendryphion nanum]
MLNALKLSELLAKNVDPQLYPRMFVMSPNGTLMAYSTPVDIKDLRDQAALISMAWKDHEKQIHSKIPSAESNNSSSPPSLETLTIEFQQNNIIVRAIQPQLLLVLVGGVPPYRKPIFKITPEVHGSPRYPPGDVTNSDLISSAQNAKGASGENSLDIDSLANNRTGKKKASSIASTMSQREKDVKSGVLHIQRRKIEALSDFIRADFESKGFVMPEDSSFP